MDLARTVPLETHDRAADLTWTSRGVAGGAEPWSFLTLTGSRRSHAQRPEPRERVLDPHERLDRD